MEGFECRYPCLNNYIEIKFLKDKTATGLNFLEIFLNIVLGARICCDKILRISSEEYTEVLIMKKGNIGEYDISYKAGKLFKGNNQKYKLFFTHAKIMLKKFFCI